MFLEDKSIVFELSASYKSIMPQVIGWQCFFLLYYYSALLNQSFYLCLTVFYSVICAQLCPYTTVFFLHFPIYKHLGHCYCLALFWVNTLILSVQLKRFLLDIHQEVELLSYVYYVPNCFPRWLYTFSFQKYRLRDCETTSSPTLIVPRPLNFFAKWLVLMISIIDQHGYQI